MKRVVLLLLVVACKRQAAAPPPAAEAPRPAHVTLSAEAETNAGVEVRQLEPRAFKPTLKLPATIVGDPRHVAHVGARVPGRISAIRVKLGDTVRKNQPLLEIESVEIHEATLKYLTASARLRAAEDALARQKQLVAERVGALADLRRSESEEATARAALDEAQEHLHFLGLTDEAIRGLARHTASTEHPGVVRAPIAGRVASLTASLGQVVTGNEEVIVITQLDRVWASLKVYERDLRFVSRGTEVELALASYPDRTWRGAVDFLGELVDPVTRTTEARVPLPNEDAALRPGMTATAHVEIPSPDDALWLPVDAVQTIDGRPTVFVRTAARRYEPRPVSVGDERGGLVPVTGGVAQGTAVVVRGAFALRGELERAALEEE